MVNTGNKLAEFLCFSMLLNWTEGMLSEAPFDWYIVYSHWLDERQQDIHYLILVTVDSCRADKSTPKNTWLKLHTDLVTDSKLVPLSPQQLYS